MCKLNFKKIVKELGNDGISRKLGATGGPDGMKNSTKIKELIKKKGSKRNSENKEIVIFVIKTHTEGVLP